MRIYLETYGCTSNNGDSAKIKDMLIQYGHEVVGNIEHAELTVLNTCTVTQTTENKILKRINNLAESGMKIAVLGCMVAAQPVIMGQLRAEHNCIAVPDFGKNAACNLLKIIGQDGEAKNPDLQSSHETTQVVKISDGCVGNCSYCIVKKAKGELKSRLPEDIVKDVEMCILNGAKEIQITSQDTACYGMDIGYRLHDLLKDLCRIEGEFMIRVGMMNPFTAIDIVDGLVDAFQSDKIFKFLHIPVQSGSDKVLADMNRGHSASDFIFIVDRFRNAFPDLTLSTDFIIGYPTETEDDHIKSINMLNAAGADRVNITRFSKRPKTLAYSLYDMPDRIKKDRSREMSKAHLKLSEIRNKRWIGKRVNVLITEHGKNNTSIGRDITYKNIVVKDKLSLGTNRQVLIVDAVPMYLIGECIN